jgi:hypothetical protein
MSYKRQELLTVRAHLDAQPALVGLALLAFIYFDVLCI